MGMGAIPHTVAGRLHRWVDQFMDRKLKANLRPIGKEAYFTAGEPADAGFVKGIAAVVSVPFDAVGTVGVVARLQAKCRG